VGLFLRLVKDDPVTSHEENSTFMLNINLCLKRLEGDRRKETSDGGLFVYAIFLLLLRVKDKKWKPRSVAL
jgi:hypothetical protein